MTAGCATGPAPSAAGPGSSPAAAPDTAPSADGDAAVWDLAPGQTLTASSTRFTALVSRLGCNDGVTGQVLTPQLRLSESEIVVTFSVAPKQTGAASCPGNNQVPYEVDLGTPLRNRVLSDGRCLPGEAAATTAFCIDGATRFRP
ncbi:hypothetical protein [Catellatospora vulcania]|uniref:hypothetical protein n=1 Tax=Catellatospora vulcania TaxID=1460450 RepID=UPI0012D49F49|nr:hypothetical protein [Catellatospora vulcania]